MNKINSNVPHSRQASAKKILGQIPAGVTQHYLAECESLRGIAILLVIVFHAYLQNAPELRLQPNIFNAFIIAGNTGVTLFFVLSGFLLNLPFLRNQKPLLSTFFKNRALRILPMYVFAVLIGGIYHSHIPAAVQALFFWNLDVGILWPFGSTWWSLMVEVQFYLLLPLLYLIARSKRLHCLIYPAFFVGCFSYLLFTGRLPWKPNSFYFIAVPKNSILCAWPVFFLGGILAWIHNNYRAAITNYASNSRFLSNGGSDLILFTILLALGAQLLRVSRLGTFSAYVDFYDHIAIEAALWALLIAAILYLPLKTKLIWSNPVLSFFGVISYSLYLVHFPILFFGLQLANKYHASLPDISKPAVSALLLIIATGLSLLTYILIEKPALNLKHKGTDREEPRQAGSFSSMPKRL
jgi:peptidoglycan/LPS O-acetylase OafA/YrhL